MAGSLVSPKVGDESPTSGMENDGRREASRGRLVRDGAVVVRVVVPGGTKSKDVRCDVKDVGTEKSTLRLEVATLAPDALVVDGELFYPVKAADSSWSLEDAKGGRRELALTMEKKHENLRWLALLRSGFGPPGAVAMRSE